MGEGIREGSTRAGHGSQRGACAPASARMNTARSWIHLGVAAALLAGCGPGQLDDAETGSSAAQTDTDTITSASEVTTSPPASSETDTETGASTSSATEFVPDDYDAPQGPCDPFMQDCAEGEKCVPYASSGGGWDGHKCVPVLGDGGVGEACTYTNPLDALDDCDANGYCWGIGEDDMGTCHAFCMGTPDDPVCPPGSTCLISGSGSLGLCFIDCHPLLQDCPNESTACYWSSGSFQCSLTSEDLPPGAPCGFINDCAAGQLCTTSEVLPMCNGAACCSPFCALGQGDEACAVVPGTSCLPFFEEGAAPPGLDDLGLCYLI